MTKENMSTIQDATRMKSNNNIPVIDSTTFKYRFTHLVQALRRSPVGIVGLVLITLVLFSAIFGPLISPHDPTQHDLRARFKPPGFEGKDGVYLLGTDQLGRDILSRLIAGSRISVIVGLTSVIISGLIGVVYGLVSGFSGGLVDSILMRIADAFLGIPYIVLVVAVSGVVGAGLSTIILILGLTGWVSYARVVRGEVMVVRELEFITSARVVGQTNLKIMSRHILPNVMASVIILGALSVGTAILAESSLSFLGLGVQPPTITWGLMLSDGRQYLGSAWWMSTFPGVAITLVVLGVVFLGDWLRDVLDPHMRGRD